MSKKISSLNKFVLGSVVDFSNSWARAPTSGEIAICWPAWKVIGFGDLIWIFCHGNFPVAISHLLKAMSTYAKERHRILLTGYPSFGNLITDKIKREFLQSVAVSILLNGCTQLELSRNTWRKSYMRTTQQCYSEQILEAAPTQNSSCTVTNHPSKTNKICAINRDRPISDVLQWNPTRGRTSVSRPAKNLRTSALYRT